MRALRLLGEGTSYYHVISRIVEKRFYLGDDEKNVFCDMMRRVAGFSGVKVLTYCIMDNHFHLLVQVPARKIVDDEELMRRLKLIYRGRDWDEVQWEFERCKGNPGWEKATREKYTRRMYDLSEFMKTLKLRFSIWYNKNHNRFGSLWSDRFKSLLVEGSETALLTVATYIDLNPVRAGIVTDPKFYRWCGFGAACVGRDDALDGLELLLNARSKTSDAQVVMFWYREYFDSAFNGHMVRKNTGEASENVGSLLCGQVRYFSDGYALGCQQFVDGIFTRRRELFSEKRRSGARKMRGGDWDGLCVLRDLQVNVFGTST